MRRGAQVAGAVVAVLALAGVAGACSSDDTTTPGTTTTEAPGTTATTLPVGGQMMTTVPSEQIVTGDMLFGRTFESTSVTGRELVPGSTITVSFTETDLRVDGGCNGMSGPYLQEGSTIRVTGDLQSTLMGCEQELMDQDAWLAEWLADDLTVQPTADGIALSGAGITVELAAT